MALILRALTKVGEHMWTQEQEGSLPQLASAKPPSRRELRLVISHSACLLGKWGLRLQTSGREITKGEQSHEMRCPLSKTRLLNAGVGGGILHVEAGRETGYEQTRLRADGIISNHRVQRIGTLGDSLWEVSVSLESQLYISHAFCVFLLDFPLIFNPSVILVLFRNF